MWVLLFGFFSSSPSDSIVLFLIYIYTSFGPRTWPKTWTLLSWGKPGALWVKYFSFVKFCFPAHSKNQTISDDRLVPGPLPAIHQTKS